MFPYRRGGKKRGKGNGGGGRRFEPGRRPPSGVQDLLGQMPSATKSLAQALAGGGRFSGQLGHARNLLAQAERIVEQHGVDRLTPAQREEFLEQLARLKLTVADAEAALAGAAEAVPAQPGKPGPTIGKERLRELALSLAMAPPREPPSVAAPTPEPIAAAPTAEEPAEEPVAQRPEPPAPPGSPRAVRLRLKTTLLPRER